MRSPPGHPTARPSRLVLDELVQQTLVDVPFVSSHAKSPGRLFALTVHFHGEDLDM